MKASEVLIGVEGEVVSHHEDTIDDRPVTVVDEAKVTALTVPAEVAKLMVDRELAAAAGIDPASIPVPPRVQKLVLAHRDEIAQNIAKKAARRKANKVARGTRRRRRA